MKKVKMFFERFFGKKVAPATIPVVLTAEELAKREAERLEKERLAKEEAEFFAQTGMCYVEWEEYQYEQYQAKLAAKEAEKKAKCAACPYNN